MLQPHDGGREDSRLGRREQPVAMRRWRVGVAALVGGAALAGAGLLIAAYGGNKPGLPAALAREELFIADPGRTGIFRADGSVVEAIRNFSADGYPSRAVDSGSGLVVYVHQGQAYMVASKGGKPPVRVGAADSVFPANDGAVGLFVGGPAGPGFVEYLAADGQLPEPGTDSTELAIGFTPVARLPSGLLVESTPRSRLDTFQLEVMGIHTTEILGAATQVLDIHANNVAWLSCASIPPTCSLLVEDTSSNEHQVISTPPGYTGYTSGGAYSPDGRFLATFVLSGRGALGLEVVDVATGTATLIRGVQGSTGTAAWSADGQWLYYGGNTGDLYAQGMRDGQPIGRQWRLPIQTSQTVSGL